MTNHGVAIEPVAEASARTPADQPTGLRAFGEPVTAVARPLARLALDVHEGPIQGLVETQPGGVRGADERGGGADPMPAALLGGCRSPMAGYGYIVVEVRDARAAMASAADGEAGPTGISRTFTIEDGQEPGLAHVQQQFLKAIADVRENVHRLDLEERWRAATETMTAAQMEAALAVLERDDRAAERDDRPAAAAPVAPQRLTEGTLVESAASGRADGERQVAPPTSAAAEDAVRMAMRPAEPPFFFVREGNPRVYGYRITTDWPEDASLLRGMEDRGLICAHSFGGQSAEGKRCWHPLAECRQIARDEFEAAEAAGWR
jgi:hypothetical protein